MAAKIQSKYTIQASGILLINNDEVFVEMMIREMSYHYQSFFQILQIKMLSSALHMVRSFHE